MDGLLFLFIVIVFAALLYYYYGPKTGEGEEPVEGRGEYEEVGDEMSDE